MLKEVFRIEKIYLIDNDYFDCNLFYFESCLKLFFFSEQLFSYILFYQMEIYFNLEIDELTKINIFNHR